MFSNDLRLEILTAAQKGELNTIELLLTKHPELLSARTTTGGSTLLHLAAVAGHEDVCNMLLKRGHETNPVNKQGKTPYQLAKTESIKSWLVAWHQDYLCGKYLDANKIKIEPKPFIGKFTEEILVMKEADFLSYIEDIDKNILQDLDHLCAATIPAANKDSDDKTKYNYTFTTIFREDIFMIPYFGDVSVMHENEQMNVQKQSLNESNHPFNFINAVSNTRALFEVNAFMASSEQAIRRYPFLGEYPRINDAPEIMEAKKIFIAFNLVGGFCCFFPKCSEEVQNEFKQDEVFQNLPPDIKTILDKPNSIKNLLIYKEMQDKYGIKKNNNINTIKK